MRHDYSGDTRAIPKVRDAINTNTDETFKEMTSENIRKLLKNIYLRSPRWFAIKEEKSISVFEHSELKELYEFPEDMEITYSLHSLKARQSRQIWRTKDGISTNTNLRLRMVTNNGISALLGLSKANKNSILTLKIQQDGVNRLLGQVRRALIAIS
jgi:hypothetical protein